MDTNDLSGFPAVVVTQRMLNAGERALLNSDALLSYEDLRCVYTAMRLAELAPAQHAAQTSGSVDASGETGER